MPVGDLEGLRHDVGDDDDADALRGDALDHLEAAPRLLDAERRERLVEQHQLAAPMDEAVELDRLALAAREMLDIGAERGNVRAGIGQRAVDRLASIARSCRTGMPKYASTISRPMKKLATTSTLVQSERSW